MIFTFYSYKGGVGRSMAMANVAEWFYQQGLRVVIIDWDLEAPGLENFFFTSDDDIERVRAKPGLIDMLLVYKDQYPTLPMTVLADADDELPADTPPAKIPQKLDTASAVEMLEKHLPPLEYFLYPLRPQTVNAQGNQQALWLLSAGWRTKERFADYGREVQNFSWSEFYESYHGEAYFEWMRKQLNSNNFADIVFIDSRTGLSEMGGVSTRQLADVVVSCAAPNVQNLDGVVAMTASFKKKEVIEARNRLDAESKRPLEVVVVPTRVEISGDQEERFFFKEEFVKRFTEYPASFRILKKTFWDLIIPYVSKYAYREKLTIGDTRGSEELQQAYKTLAGHLVLLTPEGSSIRTRFGDELRRLFGNISPRVLVADSTSDNHTNWANVRKQFKDAGLTVWDSGNTNANGQPKLSQAMGNIDLAEFLVLPVNRESVGSETFRKQWRYARQQGVCVQLVRDSEVELAKDELPLWLRDAKIYDPATEMGTLIQILKRPCITARIPYMQPELPEVYVHRPEEVGKVVEMLLGSESQSTLSVAEPGVTKPPVTRVAVCGPPGCGKTATATAVCANESVITAFSDGILWVKLGENPKVPVVFNLLYNALTGDNPSHPIPETTLAAKLQGKKCLLVVADVRKESDLQPFLRLQSTGALLFTTRDRSIAAAAGAKTMVLGVMTNSEALELLLKQSQISAGHETILNEVVSLLGNAPLPIKLAGTVLKEKLSDGEPDEAILDVYKDLQKQGVVAFDQRNSPDHKLSVAKTIAESLDSLDDRQRDYFLKLSMLPPEINAPLVSARAIWELDEGETVKLVKRFDSLSLLHYDQPLGTIRIGKLMHSFLEAQRADPSIVNASLAKAESAFLSLTPAEKSIAQRVLMRLVNLSRPEDNLPDTRKRYELEKFDAIAKPVVETLLQAELLKIEPGLKDQGMVVQLADDSLVQNWARLRKWLDDDRAFLTWRQTLEPKMGEWESSRRHNNEVLLKSKELSEARTWLYRRKDDLNESERLFITESERADKSRKRFRVVAAVIVTIAVVSFGSSIYQRYRAKQDVLTNLKVLSEAQIEPVSATIGEPDGASYNRSIDAYTKLITDNPQFAEAYYGRGNAYVALKDYDKAEKDFQNALAIRPNYPEAWRDLGNLYKLKGDLDQAIKAFSHAISVKADYTEAYFDRGDAYTVKGSSDKSSYDLAIADYTVIITRLQRDNPSAEAYYKRGLVYRLKQDMVNAIADFQKVGTLRGADPITSRNALSNLQQLTDPVTTPVPPSIFIQYNDPDDEIVVQQVADDLAPFYKVVGKPQLSSGNAIGNGDVRCFRTIDFQNANAIAALVEKSLLRQGKDRIITSRNLKDYPDVPPGQIEVWIASLKLDKVQPKEDFSQFVR